MKKLVFLFLAVTSASVFAADRVITMEEVAKHNTPASCWLVIAKNVYDVTPMMEKHNPIIKKQCGKEATKAFETKAGSGAKHSDKALELQKKFKIGVIK